MILIVLILLFVSLTVNLFLLISLKKSFQQTDLLEDWILEFQKLINQTYNKLKLIDEKRIFEKDDEVGVLFSDLLNIIKITNERIQPNDNTTNFDEKNKKETAKES